MNNAEKNTLQVNKNNYTEKQWKWLQESWNDIQQYGKQIMEEELKDEGI